MAFKVFPYKQGSASAKTLAVALGGKVLKKVGSAYRPRAGDVVINWGAGDVPQFGPARVLNRDVSTAQCKLKSFQAFERGDVRAPRYWTRKGDIPEDAYPVVCRTVLRGHSGNGITIADNRDALVDAPLYTEYVKKKDEYRIHFFNGEPFFCQRKARRLEEENPNWKVRNLAGGFVFVEVEQREVPEDVIRVGRDAVRALGLDFGGVDIMWNEREGQAYALEANTACGLEERTAERYRDAIRGGVAA